MLPCSPALLHGPGVLDAPHLGSQRHQSFCCRCIVSNLHKRLQLIVSVDGKAQLKDCRLAENSKVLAADISDCQSV